MVCEPTVEDPWGYVFPQYALIKPVLQNHIAPGPALQLHLHLFLHLFLQLLLHLFLYLYLDILLYMPQHMRLCTCIMRIHNRRLSDATLSDINVVLCYILSQYPGYTHV